MLLTVTTRHSYVRRRAATSTTTTSFSNIKDTVDQQPVIRENQQYQCLMYCNSAVLSTPSRILLLAKARLQMKQKIHLVQQYTQNVAVSARLFSNDSTESTTSSTIVTEDAKSPTLSTHLNTSTSSLPLPLPDEHISNIYKDDVDTSRLVAQNLSPLPDFLYPSLSVPSSSFTSSVDNDNIDENSIRTETQTTSTTKSTSMFFNKLLTQISTGDNLDNISNDRDSVSNELNPLSSENIVSDDTLVATDILQQLQNDEKLKQINETRRKDIEQRMKKCQRYRMKQYSLYNSTEQAFEAATAYAEQTNLGTKQEIQNWIPYTEHDARQLFEHIYSRIPMNAKAMTKMLDQYEQAIYDTSLFVIPPVKGKPSKVTKYETMAITSYPKSSLKLLTILKGLHIGIPTTVSCITDETFILPSDKSELNNLVESAVVNFVLHRRHQNVSNITSGNQIVQNSAPLEGNSSSPSSLSSFDDFMEDQKQQNIAFQSPTDVEMDFHNYKNCYHQSYDNYQRMMDVLQRTRQSIYSLKEKKTHDNTRTNPICDKTIHIASHLSRYLPNETFIGLIEFFNELCVTIEHHQQKPIKSIRHIKLHDAVDKFYYHAIAPQLADYLFDNDSGSIKSENCTSNDSSTSVDNATIYKYRSTHYASVHSYKSYTASIDYYKQLQNKFVTVLTEIQSILHNGSRVVVMDSKDAMCKKIRKSISSTGNDLVVDHTVADKIETELLQDGDDEQSTSDSKESNMKKSKFTDRDESSIRPIGFRKIKPPTDKSKFEVTHLGFEAISLELHLKASLATHQEEIQNELLNNNDHHPHLNGNSHHYINGSSNPSEHHLFTTTTSSKFDRMVFIDNLPIDISPERIEEVYSRCGKLESVQIFNQRPDLDPGRLPKAEIIKRRARQTKNSLASKTWQRPKTPVYGLLSFVDDIGYKKAINESLRIFGMIIQRHPVRSIPSWSMTSLHIEDIPKGHPCIDLEYQLSQALEPDIFVCLNAGQNYTATVGSCDIKFPTFEIAFDSREKLIKNLDILAVKSTSIESTNVDEGPAALKAKETSSMSNTALQEEASADESAILKPCRINWMASQPDAYKWWTRQYSFD